MAIAATVLSCARTPGNAGGGGGIRARRHDGLRPKDFAAARAQDIRARTQRTMPTQQSGGLTELMLDPEPVPGVRFFEVPNLPPY